MPVQLLSGMNRTSPIRLKLIGRKSVTWSHSHVPQQTAITMVSITVPSVVMAGICLVTPDKTPNGSSGVGVKVCSHWTTASPSPYYWRAAPLIFSTATVMDRMDCIAIARFICTVCTRRILWSCEVLTSIPQQICWIQLKHLLLRLCTTCHYRI